MSPCVGSLRRTALGPQKFFHRLNPHWFLQPEVVGTYLPATGTLGRGAWYGAGLLAPEIFLLNFYPPHMGKRLAGSMSVPLLPVLMDVVSLIP